MENEEIEKRQKLTVGDWLITLIIQAIPLVGIIMLFIWAFSKETHPCRKNWAKAMLALLAIAIVISITLFFIFKATILGMANEEILNSSY